MNTDEKCSIKDDEGNVYHVRACAVRAIGMGPCASDLPVPEGMTDVSKRSPYDGFQDHVREVVHSLRQGGELLEELFHGVKSLHDENVKLRALMAKAVFQYDESCVDWWPSWPSEFKEALKAK